MKMILFVLLFCGIARDSHAQFFNSFFNQNKAYIRNLILQREALNAYKKVLTNGYKIAKTGLKVINGFKEGELGLHSDFFQSLKSINPAIKNYSRVPEIIQMQFEILKRCQATRKKIGISKQYTIEEMTYVNEVYERLHKDCDAALNDLIDFVTASKLEMRDDERLEQIDGIYQDMKDMYVFSENFSAEALGLCAAREKGGIEIKTLKRIQGISDINIKYY